MCAYVHVSVCVHMYGVNVWLHVCLCHPSPYIFLCHSVMWKHRPTSESGNSKVSHSPKRVTEVATTTNPTLTAVRQPSPQKWTKPLKAGDQTGCIVYSVSDSNDKPIMLCNTIPII